MIQIQISPQIKNPLMTERFSVVWDTVQSFPQLEIFLGLEFSCGENWIRNSEGVASRNFFWFDFHSLKGWHRTRCKHSVGAGVPTRLGSFGSKRRLPEWVGGVSFCDAEIPVLKARRHWTGDERVAVSSGGKATRAPIRRRLPV